MMIKRKLDGVVDESLADQEIPWLYITYGKSGGLYLTEPGVMIVRQLDRQNLGKVWNFKSLL